MVVHLLLELDADVMVKDKNGETALQEAVARGYDKVVESLREHGKVLKTPCSFSTQFVVNDRNTIVPFLSRSPIVMQ